MSLATPMQPRTQLLLGAALLALLMAPPLRQLLESSMSLHMLAQYPLLLLAGALLAGALPADWRRHIEAWNAYGISGLVAFAVLMALLMIPRWIDLALVDLRFEAAKVLALAAAGAALRLSWSRAGWVVQGFSGNVLPMNAVAASYREAPLRLCTPTCWTISCMSDKP